MSSAKELNFNELTLKRTEMFMLYNNGPNTDPCGIPDFTRPNSHIFYLFWLFITIGKKYITAIQLYFGKKEQIVYQNEMYVRYKILYYRKQCLDGNISWLLDKQTVGSK